MALNLSTANYSILGLPIYYALCVVPHAYAIFTATKGSPPDWDNRNPRSASLKDGLSKSLDKETYARYERAEAAHYNGLESFAYLSVAVVAGNMAKLPNDELNQLIIGTSALRVLYNIAYIGIKDNGLSYIRSGLWAAGLGLCMKTLWSAGKALQ